MTELGRGFSLHQRAMTDPDARHRSDLEFREALLELQSEASIDGILVVDEAWRPRWWNTRFCELSGIAADELAAADDRFIRSVLNALAEPGELLAEIRDLTEDADKTIRSEMLMRDGRVFDRWTAPLRGRDGSRLGWAWTIRDITDRKAAERSLREGEEEADLLAEASSILASSLQREVILERVAGLITERLADVCMFERPVSDDDEPRVALSFGEPRLRSRFDELAEVYRRDPLAGAGSQQAIATGETCIVEIPPGPEERLEQDRRLLARLGLAYTVSVPLRTGSRVMGSITLGSTSVGGRARHARLAQTLATRISVALENLELYDERDRMARTLQEALRPRTLPEIPGVEVASRYRPAGDGSEIGGDFYDLFRMRGRSWAAVLGDVSGKGAEAARLTALTRYTLRAAVLGTRAPVRMLAVLNATLLGQQDSDRFCSVLCARITRRLGAVRIELANAGHPLPYVMGPSGLKRVGRGGTLLGVVREPSVGRDVFRLRTGEALVLCTDGVVEARQGEEFFGEERLEALLARHADSSAASIAEAIEAAALDFQGGVARDDIAILVVQRVRSQRRASRR